MRDCSGWFLERLQEISRLPGSSSACLLKVCVLANIALKARLPGFKTQRHAMRPRLASRRASSSWMGFFTREEIGPNSSTSGSRTGRPYLKSCCLSANMHSDCMDQSLQAAICEHRSACMAANVPLRPRLFDVENPEPPAAPSPPAPASASSDRSPDNSMTDTQTLYLQSTGTFKGVLQVHKAGSCS